MRKKDIKNQKSELLEILVILNVKKFHFVLTLLLLPIISKSQTNGLDVDMQYDQRIQDARYNDQQLNNVYAKRYKKFKLDYFKALSSNEMRDNPKVLPLAGKFDVIITNSGSLFEKAEVVTSGNKVISLKTSKGEVFIPISSSEVQNFRCIVKMSESSYVEIIFTFIFT